MNVKFLLTAAFLLTAGSAMAQDTAGKVIDLLPAGVTANVNSERKMGKAKNLIVVGSPEKGYKAFFAATDDEHGEELWVTDGTPEGTRIVKDIIPGVGSSGPSYLGRLNDLALFSADDGENGRELWVSDGTEEGTKMLMDSYLFGDGDPKGFCQIDETRAVFSATTDESADLDPDQGVMQFLFITDGTAEGTKLVSDQCNVQNPGQTNTNLHTPYVRVGRRVFFKAKDLENRYGEELWVTDGTADGTYMVMDINTEKNPDNPEFTRNSGLDNMENYKNERLFFEAWTQESGHEPWTSDGTPEGTYEIYDQDTSINPNTGFGNGRGTFGPGWEVYKDRMWFRGWAPEVGHEFAGTNMQKGDYVIFDIDQITPSVDHNSYPDPGCVFDGNYFFCASTEFDAANPACFGGEMWFYDGEKVQMQYDLCPGTGCDWIKEQTVCGGTLYWYNEANDVAGGFGSGLYRLDSTTEIPVVCKTITDTGDFVHSIRNLGGSPIYASTATKRIYVYEYTKPGWDGKTDMGYLEPDFGEGTGVQAVENVVNEGLVNVYTADGKLVRAMVNADDAAKGLAKGVYVVGNTKVVVR